MKYIKYVILLALYLLVASCQEDNDLWLPAGLPSPPTETQIPDRADTGTPTETAMSDPSTNVDPATVCNTTDYETELPKPDTPENYIGRHFNSIHLPDELQSWGGHLIRLTNSDNDEFGFDFIRKGNRIMFWINILDCRDDNGRVRWVIFDAAETPELQEDEMFVPNLTICWNQSEAFENITAIGPLVGGGNEPYTINELVSEYPVTGWYLEEVIYAVRINPTTMQFEDVTDWDMTCANIVDSMVVP